MNCLASIVINNYNYAGFLREAIDSALNQTYFNAGSCRRSYQPTQMIAGNHELSACDSFSLLCFYQGDERSGRSHETWCGTLAPMPVETMASEASPSIGIAMPMPAAAPIRAPQFAAAGRATMARGY